MNDCKDAGLCDAPSCLSDGRFNEALDQICSIRNDLNDAKQLLANKLHELTGNNVPENPENSESCPDGIIARTLECQSDCRSLVSDIYCLIQLI